MRPGLPLCAATTHGRITPTVMTRSGSSSSLTTPDGRADRGDFDYAEFHWRIVSSGSWVVVTLAGELDMAHAAEARKALLELHLGRGGRLALDLHDVSFIDSTGVRLVLQAMRHAEAVNADFAVIPGTGPSTACSSSSDSRSSCRWSTTSASSMVDGLRLLRESALSLGSGINLWLASPPPARVRRPVARWSQRPAGPPTQRAGSDCARESGGASARCGA